MPRKGENIRRRSDKRWEARYIAGRSEDGKALYKSVYGKTYSEAKEKRMQAQAALINGETGSKRSKSHNKAYFDDVCRKWLQNKKNSKIKESTYNKYYGICDRYIIPEFKNIECSDVTPDMVNDFIDNIVLLSDNTVNTIIIVLNSIIRMASDNDMMKPFKVKARKYESKDIIVPSKEELESLIRSMLSSDPELQDLSRLGIIICLFTGIRIGELCALRWSDIDLDNELITINKTMQRIQNLSDKENVFSVPSSGMGRKSEGLTYISISNAKTKSSMRIVPLKPSLVELLKIMSAGKHASAFFLSGNACPVEPRTMQYRFKRYLKEAGIKDYKFHVLRHAFATRCVELGLDIKTLSEVLGHASVNITLNRYVHPTLEMKRAFMDKLDFSVSGDMNS